MLWTSKSMKKFLVFLIAFSIFGLSKPMFAESEINELPKCVVVSHCVLREWPVSDVSTAFNRVEQLIKETPRTKIIEKSNSYIHAEATTRWMHYVDDLEVKGLPEKNVLQIRSESRVGVGDNGVNKNRVEELSYRMSTYRE